MFSVDPRDGGQLYRTQNAPVHLELVARLISPTRKERKNGRKKDAGTIPIVPKPRHISSCHKDAGEPQSSQNMRRSSSRNKDAEQFLSSQKMLGNSTRHKRSAAIPIVANMRENSSPHKKCGRTPIVTKDAGQLQFSEMRNSSLQDLIFFCQQRQRYTPHVQTLQPIYIFCVTSH